MILKKTRIFVVLIGFVLLQTSFKRTEEERFWNWFVKNQETYYGHTSLNFEEFDRAYKDLDDEVRRIHPNLKFILQPIDKNGVRELIISAQGIRSLFPKVMEIIEKAPKLEGWKFTAFKQRIKDNAISKGVTYSKPKLTSIILSEKGEKMTVFTSKKLVYEDVFFRYSDMSKQLDLELHIRDYKNTRENRYAVKKLLTNLLGEYDLEIEIDWINCLPLNEENERKDIYPMLMLRDIVDQRKLNRSKTKK